MKLWHPAYSKSKSSSPIVIIIMFIYQSEASKCQLANKLCFQWRIHGISINTLIAFSPDGGPARQSFFFEMESQGNYVPKVLVSRDLLGTVLPDSLFNKFVNIVNISWFFWCIACHSHNFFSVTCEKCSHVNDMLTTPANCLSFPVVCHYKSSLYIILKHYGFLYIFLLTRWCNFWYAVYCKAHFWEEMY